MLRYQLKANLDRKRCLVKSLVFKTQGLENVCKEHVWEREFHISFWSMIYLPLKLRPRLHGIGSKWDRIHLDPIHFLMGVYTGSDPELLAFTRYRIHLNFMNSWQRSSKPFLLFQSDPLKFCTLIDFVTSLIPLFEMSTKDFRKCNFLSVPVWIRSHPFTRDLFGIGSKRDHFRKWSRLGTDSRSKWVRIRWVPCKRKAYPLQFGYGSIWIRSRVNGAWYSFSETDNYI